MSETRINKYLAEHGYCSRREADRLIASGRVRINDQTAELGDRVYEGDQVQVSGRAKTSQKESLVYLLLHKPVGVITTTDRRKRDNVIDFLDFPKRIFPVGRLDVESSGLLLLTNDGVLANRLMHPRYEHEKEYVVEVDRPLAKADIGRLASGVMLEDGKTLPAKVRQLGAYRFAIILREGRNRQIRRMVDALGFEVRTLKRTRIATLKLGTFPEGSFRHLSPGEVRDLKKTVGMKTEERSTKLSRHEE